MPRTPANADPPEHRHHPEAALAPLRAVAAAVSDAIVCADPAGTITLWTGGAQAIFGWSADEAIGRPLSIVMPARHRDAYMRAFTRAAQGREPELVGGPPVQVEGLRQDGSEFPAELTISRGEEDGQPFLVGVLRDVSHRRRAELELQVAQDLFRSAFEHAQLGMTLATPEGVFISVNAAFCAFTGFSREELEGRHFSMVADPTEREADRAILEPVLAGLTDRFHVPERRFRRKDGTVVLGELVGSAVLDESGRPLHVLTQVLDIEERRRAERELARSNADLEHFAHLASHDLNEPLRILDGFLRLLDARVGDRLGEDGRRFVAHALGASTRMRELIEAFLHFASSGGGEVSCDPVDLDRLAREAVTGLGVAIADRRVVVQVDDLPRARGDAALLRQVLQNLLGNAIRHAAPEHGRVRVRATRTATGEVEVSVADNGPGVPADEREHVFDMYVKSSGGGTGLGLAICRRVVERHGGRIWIDEAPGGGADVRFTLPAEADG